MGKTGEELPAVYRKGSLFLRLHLEPAVIARFTLLLMTSTSTLAAAAVSMHHDSYLYCLSRCSSICSIAWLSADAGKGGKYLNPSGALNRLHLPILQRAP